TFTADGELVCRHAQCDLHTTTNIITTELNNRCTVPWDPSNPNPDTVKCCASDITLAEFKTLKGKMDSANNQATTAKDYQVEVLIFENLTAGRAYEPHRYQTPEAMLSNSETWQVTASLLVDQATAIKNSRDFRLLKHFSWGQKSLPYSQSAAYQIVEQNINGWFKIYATQLLFANVDMDFNGYRMNEKRRLKLNEKHFFDHPKFGILLQVSRLEIDNNETEEAKESEQIILENSR
nr:hypothetical protein [Acidiferrobacterales bacterium]